MLTSSVARGNSVSYIPICEPLHYVSHSGALTGEQIICHPALGLVCLLFDFPCLLTRKVQRQEGKGT